MKSTHWTEEHNGFHFFICDEFVDRVKERLRDKDISHREFAVMVGVSEGRISQIMNNPQLLSLKSIVAWARAIGLKVSLIAYDDGDPSNELGPVPDTAFIRAWVLCGSGRKA